MLFFVEAFLVLCTDQFEASTSPREYPGHLTVILARGGGGGIWTLPWKGAEFEPDLSLVLV